MRGGCGGVDCCADKTSSSDWLFGLWPGPPQRFIRTGGVNDNYQHVWADRWPQWGGDVNVGGLRIGSRRGPPGGSHGSCACATCNQGHTYRGTGGEICGGLGSWGATDVEVWYPR